MFIGKSLIKSNIVFIFRQDKFFPPENEVFSTIYSGDSSKGARFIDDPILQTKVYFAPEKQLSFALEGTRLRVDDDSGLEPEKSILIGEALAVYSGIFKKMPVSAYGFNFDINYKFGNVLPADLIFRSYFDDKVRAYGDLRELGIQFTLEKKEDLRVYFLKYTSPLEIAVHANYHYRAEAVLSDKNMKDLYAKCFREADDIINSLKP